MSLSARQLMNFVVRPALERLHPVVTYTHGAAQLVLGTAIVESGLEYIDQIDKSAKPGPAYGLWQIERLTFNDHLKRMSKSLEPHMFGYLSVPPSVEDLHWNLRLGASMCRVIYFHAPERIPEGGDFEGMARLWKKRFNTPLGRGSVEKAIPCFRLACTF